MKKMICAIMPAYNEEENILALVEDWYPTFERIVTGDNDFCMVIINDGSKDGTYDILCKITEDYPKLIPLSKPNGGHGSAVLYGYRYAIKCGAEWIFQTDSDGQTDPNEFEDFWKKRFDYDAIIGNRIVRGDGNDRKFVENVVCFLLGVIFGIKVKDANAPFRLMKTRLVKKYIDKLPHDFNIPNIMFTTYFVYNRENVLFLPITFKPRKKGTNSINPQMIIKIGWKAVGDFIKLRREMDE